eukprot:scaffold74454_cov65-Phaeocystis_antarctica.AAC.8
MVSSSSSSAAVGGSRVRSTAASRESLSCCCRSASIANSRRREPDPRPRNARKTFRGDAAASEPVPSATKSVRTPRARVKLSFSCIRNQPYTHVKYSDLRIRPAGVPALSLLVAVVRSRRTLDGTLRLRARPRLRVTNHVGVSRLGEVGRAGARPGSAPPLGEYGGEQRQEELQPAGVEPEEQRGGVDL